MIFRSENRCIKGESEMGQDTSIQWRDVPNHPGYRVSSQGDVMSAWRRVGLGRGRGCTVALGDNWRLMSQSTNQRGYKFLNLGRNNTKVVHRLVLEAFSGPCPDGMEARHLNGNPSDNRIENLAWGSAKENQADQYVHGTRVGGKDHHWSKLGPSQVRAIRTLWASGHWNQREIGELFGVTQPVVSSIVNLKHRVTAAEERA